MAMKWAIILFIFLQFSKSYAFTNKTEIRNITIANLYDHKHILAAICQALKKFPNLNINDDEIMSSQFDYENYPDVVPEELIYDVVLVYDSIKNFPVIDFTTTGIISTKDLILMSFSPERVVTSSLENVMFFDYEVAVLFVTTLFTVATTILIVDYLSRSMRNYKSKTDCLKKFPSLCWNLMATLFDQSMLTIPKRWTTRIIYFFWLLGFIFLLLAIRGVLKSDFSKIQYESINTPLDLLKYPGRTVDVCFHEDKWEMMKKTIPKLSKVKSVSYLHLESDLKGKSFKFTKRSNFMYLQDVEKTMKYFHDANVFVPQLQITEPLFSVPLFYLVSKKLPLVIREEIIKGLMNIFESKTFDDRPLKYYLERKLWRKPIKDNLTMTYDKFSPLLLLYLIFLAFSSLVLLIEIAIEKYRSRRKDNLIRCENRKQPVLRVLSEMDLALVNI